MQTLSRLTLTVAFMLGAGAAYAAGAPAHDAGHSAGFPPFDATTFPSQLLWFAIAFGTLYLFVSRVVVPRVGGMIEERRDRISTDLDEASRMKMQADDALAAYEKSLADAKSKAQGLAQAARDEAQGAADARRRQLEADLATKLAAAEATISARKTEAMGNVSGIATEAAQAIVEKLIGKAPAAASVERAVGAALKD